MASGKFEPARFAASDRFDPFFHDLSSSGAFAGRSPEALGALFVQDLVVEHGAFVADIEDPFRGQFVPVPIVRHGRLDSAVGPDDRTSTEVPGAGKSYVTRLESGNAS